MGLLLFVLVRAHRVSALSLSRSLVAHTRPRTTLQLLAPHTLTHSRCDVKGVKREWMRASRIHSRLLSTISYQNFGWPGRIGGQALVRLVIARTTNGTTGAQRRPSKHLIAAS
jgi:hypothetical protein